MSKEDLEQKIFVEKMSYEEIGRLCGVTGAAIKKRAKRMGIKLIPKRNINPKENFSHPKTKKQIICPVCGNIFYPNHKGMITCSKKCAAKYRGNKKHLNFVKKIKESKWDGVERKDMWTIEGRTICGGYVWAKCRQHPNAFKDGYILEHRLVVENHIGRLLRENEIVHHIDGNKRNNNISNLMILTKEEHARLHYQEREKEGKGLCTFQRTIAVGKNTKDGHFDETDIIHIRDMYSKGSTTKDIANLTGVTTHAISSIVKRRTYKWIN